MKVLKYIWAFSILMKSIKGSLPEEVEKAFRRRAMEHYGYAKGAVSKALEDAIKLWLRYDFYESEEEEENNQAFDALAAELEAKHAGKYAVIGGGRLISICDSLREALAVEGSFSHRLVFKIGEEPSSKVRLGWRVKRIPAGSTQSLGFN